MSHVGVVDVDIFFFFFFNDTATTEIYTLSLHDALPISFYESAVRADPRPLHQAALAQAFILDPTQKDRSRAKALLAEACKDATCDRALFVAGMVAREAGEIGEAERFFRAAVKANPRSGDAARELRELEKRRADKRR